MVPATYNFSDIYKGDTMEDVTFQITEDGSAVDLTGSAIKMQLRHAGKLYADFSLASSSIVVLNSTGGQFKVCPGIVDIPARVYNYDIEVTLASGDRKTYIAGTINVLPEITEAL